MGKIQSQGKCRCCFLFESFAAADMLPPHIALIMYMCNDSNKKTSQSSTKKRGGSTKGGTVAAAAGGGLELLPMEMRMLLHTQEQKQQNDDNECDQEAIEEDTAIHKGKQAARGGGSNKKSVTKKRNLSAIAEVKVEVSPVSGKAEVSNSGGHTQKERDHELEDASQNAKHKRARRVVVDEGNDDGDGEMRRSEEPIVGNSEAQSSASSSAAASAPTSTSSSRLESNTVQWRINWNAYMHWFKVKACVDYSIERMGVLAGIVVKLLLGVPPSPQSGDAPGNDTDAMLALQTLTDDTSSNSFWRGEAYYKGRHKHGMDLKSLYSAILTCDISEQNTNPPGANHTAGASHKNSNSLSAQDHTKKSTSTSIQQLLPNVDALKNLLKLMMLDNIICIGKKKKHSNTSRATVGNAVTAAAVALHRNDGRSGNSEKEIVYAVNMYKIMDLLKRKTVHNIICERHGIHAGRIVELLRKHKYVEQQKISELAIMPARDAREKLYALYR